MGTKLSKPKALFLLAIFVLVLSRPVAGAPVNFSASQEFLHLKTGHYEVAFDRTTGGLVQFLDVKTGKPLSWAAEDAKLWGVTFTNGEQVFSSAYHGHFTYKWNALFQRLTFYYHGTAALPLDVTKLRSAPATTNASKCRRKSPIITRCRFKLSISRRT